MGSRFASPDKGNWFAVAPHPGQQQFQNVDGCVDVAVPHRAVAFCVVEQPHSIGPLASGFSLWHAHEISDALDSNTMVLVGVGLQCILHIRCTKDIYGVFWKTGRYAAYIIIM